MNTFGHTVTVYCFNTCLALTWVTITSRTDNIQRVGLRCIKHLLTLPSSELILMTSLKLTQYNIRLVKHLFLRFFFYLHEILKFSPLVSVELSSRSHISFVLWARNRKSSINNLKHSIISPIHSITNSDLIVCIGRYTTDTH